VTNVADTVLQWFSDNFKLLSAAAVALAIYLIANAEALGLSDAAKVLIGAIPVILAVTDPNRDHVSNPPTAATTTTTTP
jgi:hypothetical protein